MKQPTQNQIDEIMKWKHEHHHDIDDVCAEYSIQEIKDTITKTWQTAYAEGKKENKEQTEKIIDEFINNKIKEMRDVFEPDEEYSEVILDTLENYDIFRNELKQKLSEDK